MIFVLSPDANRHERYRTRAEIDVHRDSGDNDRIFHYHEGFALDRTGDTIAIGTGDEMQGSTSYGRVDVFHRDGGAYQKVATVPERRLRVVDIDQRRRANHGGGS